MKELPKGCKARRYQDGFWCVVNDAETHWWFGSEGRWQPETIATDGNYATSEDAVHEFFRTYTGQPIPGGTDAPWAKDGPLARITPEADEQVDGKGRTLVEIDKRIDHETARIWNELSGISAAVAGLKGTVQGMYDRVDLHGHKISGLDSLIAARVSKPCEPSKATGENELATAVEAADWREALVPIGYPNGDAVWWRTPDGKCESQSSSHAAYGWYDSPTRTLVVRTWPIGPQYIAVRDALPEPPNLREWWPVKADTRDGLEVANATNDLLIKELDSLRRQLATAQSDLLSMTAQRDNAVKRATAAEQALAETRASLERIARTSDGKPSEPPDGVYKG